MLRIRHLSPQTINDASNWEYYSGNNTWSKHFHDLEAILVWQV